MKRGRSAASLLVVLAMARTSGAQITRRPVPTPTPSPRPPGLVVQGGAAPADDPNDLRGRFGMDLAARLARSSDPDERLRALARAGSIGTPDAVALLASVLDATSPMRADVRAKIEAARGLAGHVEVPSARAALLALVTLPSAASGRNPSLPFRAPTDPFGDEAEQAARLEVARRTAALALAESGDGRAIDGLLSIARGGGSGQAAAALAILAHPPVALASLTSGTMSPAALRLLAELGDLRTIDAIRVASHASDVATRAAALVALGALGDTRAVETAQAALAEADPRLRAAAAEALVALDAPSRLAVVEALLADDATAVAGIRLAERAHSDGIARALAARAVAASDPAVRAAAIASLGRSPSAEAVRALAALVRDPRMQGDAAGALATSPSAEAMAAIESLIAAPATRRLGVRAYLARARGRGERSARAERVLLDLARSPDVRDRALAVFARVLAGDEDVAAALGDREAEVRRSAALATLGDTRAATHRALLARLDVEPDPATREVLAAGLVDGDADGRVTTTSLLDRAEAGGPDAPLAAMALARRADEAQAARLDALLASRDPLMRAHVARGLAASPLPASTGHLADAYAYEAEASVRRAIVLALASRPDADAPVARATLLLAARLDPDAAVRALARRARAESPRAGRRGMVDAPAPDPPRELAWLRLTTLEGGAPSPTTAAFVRADGLAVPIAFDGDGYALVPGAPPGPSRLVLAPRLPGAYERPLR